MTYKLPKKMPDQILVRGKTYKRVGGQRAVERGVCKSNDGSWHYYFNISVVDGEAPDIGQRRHFSVHNAKGHRSVHISMKAHATTGPKKDNIMIWYRYDTQWTGKTSEPEGWGRTRFDYQNQDRLNKAIGLLTDFLEAMHEVAEPSAKPVTPCLSPPISAIPISTGEGMWDDPPSSTPKPSASTASTSSAPVVTKDAWDD
jgi:hypothetical protein